MNLQLIRISQTMFFKHMEVAMKRHARWISLLLCLLFILGCAGCTPDTPGPDQQQTNQNQPEQNQDPDQQDQPTPTEPILTAREQELLTMPALDLPTVAADRLTGVSVTLPQIPQQAKPVIFIADGGTGDGSSPDSPLELEDSNNVVNSGGTGASRPNFYNSLLYQAAAKLYGTGGTIVLVGPVLCDGNDGIGENEYMELRLPHLGGASITITSMWNGVDYRQTNGAKLILQSPVCLALNNPVAFRDVDICTQNGSGYSASNRVISADGFRLVMDSGVRCIPLDDHGYAQANPTADSYPIIVGAHRLNCLEGSTDVTLRSGTWYTVSGGCLGIGMGGYGDLHGTSKVTVEGTARIYGVLSAASPDARALQDGDATLIINGGEIYNKVQISGAGGFTGPNCTGKIVITGGTFSDSVKIMAKAGGSYFGSAPGKTMLDFSSYTGSADILSKAVGFSQIAGSDTTAEAAAIASAPYRTVYFTGDLPDLTGLTLSVTYNGKEKELTYDSTVAGLRICTADGTEIDPETFPLTEDVTALQVFCGSIRAGEIKLTVLPRPAVSIVGVSVLQNTERQELGFLFGVEAGDFPEVTIKTCGVLAVPASYVRQRSDLTGVTMTGHADLACSEIPTGLSATCNDLSGLLYASVKDIPVEEYGLEYAAVAYYTFVHDGAVYTAFSQPCTASVYAVAKQTGGAPNVVTLAENGGVSTPDEALINEKIEGMLSYFEEMATVAWTAPEDIDFAGSSVVTGALRYYKDKEYYGLPYIGGYNGYDNLENFLGQLDENGLYIGSTAWNTMHGNNCTSAIFQAMSRFSNHYDYWAEVGDPLLNIIPKMHNAAAPVIKVGPYTIRHTDAQSHVIIRNNGDQQIIYESYAVAKRGDYLFSHWLSGTNLLSHLRLVTGVHVQRNADGTIDPYTSYLTVHEQTSTMDQEAATSWGLDRKFHFVQLANEGYLPTRDAAFETGYFETPHCVIHDGNTQENIAEGLRGRIVSNYDLSEVEIEIVDTATGETVFHAADYCYFNRSCSLTALDPKDQVQKLVGTGTFEYILRVTTANAERELIRFFF